MVIEMKITNFEIYGDSKLIINQLLTLYKDGNIGNHEYIDILILQIYWIYYKYIDGLKIDQKSWKCCEKFQNRNIEVVLL